MRAAYDEMVAAAAGANIWVVGGGDLVGQFDDAGVLDEIHVHLTPVVLAWERRCFPDGSPRRDSGSAKARWSVSA